MVELVQYALIPTAFDETADKRKAVQIFDTARRYGAISEREAAIRVGKTSAGRVIEKLRALKLLTDLSAGVFGLSDKARLLIGKLRLSEQILIYAERSRP